MFDWGNPSEIGDAAWWNALNTYIKSASHFERMALVGKVKRMSLSPPVLGANAVLVRCISADMDGINTLTFQVAGLLPEPIQFNDSFRNYYNSIAHDICNQFYKSCSAHDAILPVLKGTCHCSNYYREASVAYAKDYVWLPSEREMGLNCFSPLSVENSKTTNAECTKGYNISYSYYDSKSARIKYFLNKEGYTTGKSGLYWLRSRHAYTNIQNICVINSSGQPAFISPDRKIGISPAFVIGGTDFKVLPSYIPADRNWWEDLSNVLKTCGEDNLKSFIGATVTVTLSAPVLGTTEHLVTCIGHCDGPNTLTFQTTLPLKNKIPFCTEEEFHAFGDNALWRDEHTNSLVRQCCIEYWNQSPMKDFIIPVDKKYLSRTFSEPCKATSDKTYEELVFLPSVCELGFDIPGAVDEFSQCNCARIPYKRLNRDSECWTRSKDNVNTNETNRCLCFKGNNVITGFYSSSHFITPTFVIGPNYTKEITFADHLARNIFN